MKHQGLLAGLLLAGCICAGAVEYEVNLVRNAAFKPGMDKQGSAYWLYYCASTGIFDAGRGYVEFFDGGITIAGAASLFQFFMWDDATPQYQFSCRLKSTGARGCVFMELRDRVTGSRKRHELSSRKLDEWEELSITVGNGSHYGFGVGINVAKDAKLSISHLRVTPILAQTDPKAALLIADNGGSVPARGIIASDNPDWPEIMAAHELRLNAWRTTGVALPILAGAPAESTKGYIRLTNLKKLIPDSPPERPAKKRWSFFRRRAAPADPEANGFRIVCAAGQMDVIGGNDAGLLAGIVHLSEILGVKYFAPRVFTVESNPGFEIKAMDIVKQPAFEWADGTHNHELTWTPWKYGFLYSESSVAPSGMASPPCHAGWGHPPAFLVPPFLYAQDHPDYYALVKDKRLDGYRGRNAGDLQLCLGNPALQKVVAERIMQLMEQFPQTKYFGIGQGDGPHWCECELCTALGVDKQVLTDRMIAYANAVAEITSKKHPDRKLVILAYGKGSEELPLREKLHPNVAVQYAFWPSSWPVWEATACQQNQRGMKLLDDWNALTGTNLTLSLYPVNTYENAEKIKLAASKGIRGFYHCGWRGDFPETTIYTTGQLIWDPEADVESMLDEIMPVIYGGAAAPYMREYFDMYHAFVRNCVEHPEQRRLYRDNNAHRYRRLPMPHAVEALELLTRAEAAAADNEMALIFVQKEKYKVLFGYINEFNAMHPTIPADLFEDYALKLAELVKLARTCREPYATYRVPFSEWLYQTTGVLDFDRGPYKWFSDKKIDAFLADPVNTLKTRIYLQKEVENGVELPAKAWLGSRYYEQYQGQPAAVLRRKSSPESRVRAYFKLDTLPAGDAQLELQGLDNEKAEIAEIEITINGQKIFAGPVAYPKNKWGWQTCKIPVGILAQGENVMAIANTMGDYKGDLGGGEAGPAEEALAQNYNWGWCMVGQSRIVFNKEQGLME